MGIRKICIGLLIPFLSLLCAHIAYAITWQTVDSAQLLDDDVQRHAQDKSYLENIQLSEIRFSENGFDWHLLRFVNAKNPVGPLWVVPHDDENAAFDAALAAVKRYGGVAIVVNSGPGSSRFQSGLGACGERQKTMQRCDPNRNFSKQTPVFTRAFLDQLSGDQPIIALHTNTPGHGRGRGDITILDIKAEAKGTIRPRKDGFFGQNPSVLLADHDSFAIIPYGSPQPSAWDARCRTNLVLRGVHVWHERVGKSDGSLSNYIALNAPHIHYVNMESRREELLSLAADRHGVMLSAYMQQCVPLGD